MITGYENYSKYKESEIFPNLADRFLAIIKFTDRL